MLLQSGIPQSAGQLSTSGGQLVDARLWLQSSTSTQLIAILGPAAHEVGKRVLRRPGAPSGPISFRIRYSAVRLVETGKVRGEGLNALQTRQPRKSEVGEERAGAAQEPGHPLVQSRYSPGPAPWLSEAGKVQGQAPCTLRSISSGSGSSEVCEAGQVQGRAPSGPISLQLKFAALRGFEVEAEEPGAAQRLEHPRPVAWMPALQSG
jgi:hypothetical protein